MPEVRHRAGKRRRFYNRLFIINSLVFLMILLAFASVASSLSSQMELSRLQQKNRDALAAVCSFYDSKHDGYVNMVYPFYDDRTNYQILTDLLENTAAPLFETDPYLLKDITERMARLAARDDDVEAIYLYSNASGQLFSYQRRFNTFQQMAASDVFTERLQKAVTGRVPLGVRILSYKLRTYGIASSVGTRNARSNAGKLVIAYNVAALERIWQRYAGSAAGQCLIISDEGEIIFNSGGDYSQLQYSNMALTRANGSTLEVTGEQAYIITLGNPARKYTGLMIVPVAAYAGKTNSLANLIYASCAGFALLSVLLYFLAGIRVSRRVGELEKGMAKVGAHNLGYRIQLRGAEDEFGEIARYFNRMCDDLQENIDRMYVYELKQKSAELGALQARINPHFLYNSLEAVRARVLADGNEEASDMIAQLAAMFRSITKEKTVYSIRQEVHFIQMYLNLFAFRHGGNLEFEVAIDAGVLECAIVKYLLQPVVENYFVHGYNPARTDNRLTIRGEMDGETVCLSVCDNGRGIPTERLAEIRQLLDRPVDSSDGSYGLANVNERIRLVYGTAYGLDIASVPGESTCITLRLKAMDCETMERRLAHPAGKSGAGL